MNNYDKIKNMTVNEMAKLFSNRASCAFCVYEFAQECNEAVGCEEGIKQWLETECEDE